MNKSLDDYAEIVALLTWPLAQFCFVFMFIGVLLGLLVTLWGLIRKTKLHIDWVGLLICMSLMFIYIVLPLGLRLSSGEPLDVKRHGYFGFADMYTWVVVVLVTFFITVFSIFRLVKFRERNFGLSLILFSVLTMVSALVGQIISSQFGGAWTS